MQSRRDVQRKQNRINGMKIFRRVVITILVLILVLWISFAIANHPRSQARREAYSMAKKYAHVDHPSGFYVYNRESTYYTVAGKNQQGKQVLVVIPEKGGNIHIIKQSAGISSQQAISKVRQNERPKRILRTALGYFNSKAVWEVTYINKKGALCYDLINFKTGQFIQQIDNL
ncbi:cell wall elongation regulator TseB-like domain-containing protein [Limosilactobacillus caecicola]|uniref:cell wall elongation regulator TseB-like domain-containing protein n=1 Tax=Limosilactobacillus caecicola TaxID=2941332 RepID=UPI0020411CE0|nr:DUF5590 domain-containing protein [Limosilactobacillus caecicola]